MKLFYIIFTLFSHAYLEAKEVDQICATAPLASCGPNLPCHNRNGELLLEASIVPQSCFQDGAPKYFINTKGEKRYYCEYNPPDTAGKYPLIIWLHGGGGEVKNLYRSTDLPQKARQQGFHLLALQARNTKFPYGGYHDGRHFDSYWWDFNTHSSNQDIADMDKLIQTVIEKGTVNPRKIYMIGWSEGGFFSQLYGMVREKYPSPYGTKIAAVATFSASSPFLRSYEDKKTCIPSLNFKTNLPIMLIGHSCDVIACNDEQSNYFNNIIQKSDTISMNHWENILKMELGNSLVNRIIVQGHQVVANCQAVSNNTNHQPGSRKALKLKGATRVSKLERFKKFREMRIKNGGGNENDQMNNRKKIFQNMRQQNENSSQPDRPFKKMGNFQGRLTGHSNLNKNTCDLQTAKINHLTWPKHHEQLILNYLLSH